MVNINHNNSPATLTPEVTVSTALLAAPSPILPACSPTAPAGLFNPSKAP